MGIKITKNAAHNSIELSFGGEKPSDEIRKLMKAYGFWWFREEKKWIHSLEIDGEFFEKFVEERIKPLVESSSVATPEAIKKAVGALDETARQELLAQLLGK